MLTVFLAMSLSVMQPPNVKAPPQPQPPTKNPQPQPPGKDHPPHHHPRMPSHNTWHHWHGKPLVQFNAILPSPVVVIQNPDTIYAQVDSAGNIIATFRLVPVVAEAPVVVVPQTTYRSRGWIFGNRYRR